MASRAEWANRVKRWQASGLSAGEFAAREGYAERSLHWWKWKLKSIPTAAPASMASVFLPVHVVDAEPDPPRAEEAFEIALPNGRVLRIPPKFDAATLERLLVIVARGGE